jgi:hypothetical protein
MKKIYIIVGLCIIIAAIAIGSLIILRQTPSQQSTPAQNVGEEGNPWVATYDTSGNPQTLFELGDTVRIKAYSHATPYYIYVIKPDGALKKTIGPINTPSYSGDHGDITTDLGWWTLNVFDKEAHMGVGQYHVIPEAALGTIGALSAAFAAAFLKYRKAF